MGDGRREKGRGREERGRRKERKGYLAQILPVDQSLAELERVSDTISKTFTEREQTLLSPVPSNPLVSSPPYPCQEIPKSEQRPSDRTERDQ